MENKHKIGSMSPLLANCSTVKTGRENKNVLLCVQNTLKEQSCEYYYSVTSRATEKHLYLHERKAVSKNLGQKYILWTMDSSPRPHVLQPLI